MTKPTYQIQIVREGKHDYAAVLADLNPDKPEKTTVMAKSMPELMAKCLVALVLRDKRLGEAEPATCDVTIQNNTEAPPIILTPSRKIVPPTA